MGWISLVVTILKELPRLIKLIGKIERWTHKPHVSDRADNKESLISRESQVGTKILKARKINTSRPEINTSYEVNKHQSESAPTELKQVCDDSGNGQTDITTSDDFQKIQITTLN